MNFQLEQYDSKRNGFVAKGPLDPWSDNDTPLLSLGYLVLEKLKSLQEIQMYSGNYSYQGK